MENPNLIPNEWNFIGKGESVINVMIEHLEKMYEKSLPESVIQYIDWASWADSELNGCEWHWVDGEAHVYLK